MYKITILADHTNCTKYAMFKTLISFSDATGNKVLYKNIYIETRQTIPGRSISLSLFKNSLIYVNFKQIFALFFGNIHMYVCKHIIQK